MFSCNMVSGKYKLCYVYMKLHGQQTVDTRVAHGIEQFLRSCTAQSTMLKPNKHCRFKDIMK
jgi:hypothetical protein